MIVPEKKTAPKVNAPVEEHRKHTEDFLTREEYKKPKGPAPKSDTANP
jgi:hypothetical protein